MECCCNAFLLKPFFHVERNLADAKQGHWGAFHREWLYTSLMGLRANCKCHKTFLFLDFEGAFRETKSTTAA